MQDPAMQRPAMKRLLSCSLLALALGLSAPVSVHAQPQTRAYAPENLRTLSYQDQVRVIGLEYSEQSRGRRIPDDQLRFYTDQVNRSNWTFSRIKQDIAQSLGGSTGPQPPRPPVAGGTIRCESTNNRPRTCRTPWAGPSRLVRQLSGTRCIEDQSWQSQQGQVYVGNGCRAEFAPGGTSLDPDYRVSCASRNMHPNTCAWNQAYGRPVLERQFSKAACIEGRSWNYDDDRGISVNSGCSAQFRPQGGGLTPFPPQPPIQPPRPGNGYSVTCSSTGNRDTSCAWDARQGRPVLIQQLSSSPCIEGRTWGYRGGASLWVGGGCRARFGAR